MSIKVLIADDDSLIRESLKIILGMDEEFEVVSCVDDGLKAVNYCLKYNIDVALVDVRMPVMNGVQAAKEICRKTATKVLILTTFDDDEYIIDVIKSGAKGYLLKNNSPEKIKNAIKMVYEGNSVVQDVVLDKIKEGLGKDKSVKIDTSLFTRREIEIMDLISKGLSNKEIADKLYISEGTVKNYITSILDKTGLQHRTQIAIYYLNGGE
ncbi:response regulator transcription factor [Thermoanaerobacterium sp. RBIITD]|uniref:response regulator transcription factor n=1 Tax=Thermoanaerobacterium sp. RBIITD TaxID=1550240 RepID=UPI000BB7EDB5|nr:response regulator transcription factor [Thermoanaerobacterium sp. RBIITD]SNX53962.1 DNA-binding response regulator, NarL/FixJ family, contains REC and HTH domains [Thermoanaerobacterium sp. RBIITD]